MSAENVSNEKKSFDNDVEDRHHIDLANNVQARYEGGQGQADLAQRN